MKQVQQEEQHELKSKIKKDVFKRFEMQERIDSPLLPQLSNSNQNLKRQITALPGKNPPHTTTASKMHMSGPAFFPNQMNA